MRFLLFCIALKAFTIFDILIEIAINDHALWGLFYIQFTNVNYGRNLRAFTIKSLRIRNLRIRNLRIRNLRIHNLRICNLRIRNLRIRKIWIRNIRTR